MLFSFKWIFTLIFDDLIEFYLLKHPRNLEALILE